MEQKNKGRARVKIAVFFVLAVHGIGLLALLMQGCGQTQEPAPGPELADTNAAPAFVEPAPPPVAGSTPPVAAAAPAVPELPAPPPEAPAGATEYSIVKGDYLERIAKSFHVSVKAILEANPGIEPTKLKIGQRIQIPAPAAPGTAAVPEAAPAGAASAGGEQIYTVKSGDTLIGIARQFGTTQKAISAANSLKTTSIKVGQKLKIPARATAPAAAPELPFESVPAAPPAPSPTAPPGA